MKVEFLSGFSKDLDKLDDEKIKQKLFEFIELLESVLNLREIRHLKKLKGYKAAYRFRLGDYRLGLFFENETIEIARFLHRKEIYDLFP